MANISRHGEQTPKSSKTWIGEYGPLLCLLLSVVVLRVGCEVLFPVVLWNSTDDYPVHSLSHAIYLDERLTTDHQKHVGYSQTAHPGIPFQVVSWIAYRLSNMSSNSDFSSRLNAVMSDSANFSFSLKLIPVLLQIMVWLLVWREIRKQMPLYYALLLPFIFFSIGSSFTYGFMYLGNETFALPLGVALFLSLVKANENMGAHVWRWWLIAGLIGGVSYLNKLNYIMWSIGVVGGYIFAAMYLRSKILTLLKPLVLYGVGFVVATLGGGGLYLGWAGFNEMLTRHRGVVTHSGMYGSGDSGIFNLAVFVENIVKSFKDHPYFWILIVAAFLQALWVLFSRNKSDKVWLESNLTVIGPLAGAALLVMFATFKHYGPHYLIPLAVMILCLCWWSGTQASRGLQRLIIVPFVALALYGSGTAAVSSQQSEQMQIRAVRAEVAEIKKMPIDQGQSRLWSYHVSSIEYMQYFMSMLAESRWVSEVIEKWNPEDKHFDIFSQIEDAAVDRTGWRYAVFQNKYFLTQEKLPEYFKKNGILVKKYDQLMVLENVNFREKVK